MSLYLAHEAHEVARRKFGFWLMKVNRGVLSRGEKARIERCGLPSYHLLSGAQRCLFFDRTKFGCWLLAAGCWVLGSRRLA